MAFFVKQGMESFLMILYIDWLMIMKFKKIIVNNYSLKR